ncbi:MAG TPA: aldo/keto reductase [Candidatus Acidoferrales bacterium]|nr:aldo/keto reductase [Candidatus Acidoferrales bacterium]
MTASGTAYRTLGRTGLKVSPLALGGMTFGWGADKATARRLFDAYRDTGGNFIDTADLYAGGTSEEWLGEFIEASHSRDEIVLGTKFSFNAQKGNPNAGGNGRKNILRALEGSLRRLRTSYIDLYILHAWDRLTPVDEVASTLNDLVRSGKVRHIGLSDVPAWYAARFTTIADLRGWERPAALQLEYSLVSRSLEREHMPMAQELGISITPWSPLGSGFLSGKFRRVDGKITGSGRVLDMKDSGNPTLEKFAKREQNWQILGTLLRVAEGLGRTPAEVALGWVMTRPCVTSTLIGATRVEQLEKNLAAARLNLPQDALTALTDASAPEPNELDHFFGDVLQGMIHGETRVERTAF